MTHDVNSRRRHLWTTAGAAICTAVLGTMAAGQTAPTFDAASIKPNKSGDLRSQLGGPPGRFVGTNVTLRALILASYQLQGFQLVGGPAWLDSDRFDIVATTATAALDNPFAPGAPQGPTAVQLMLRTLLADRFKLVVHNENRDLPIYAMALARPDGKPGPQLTTAATDCAAILTAALAGRRGGGPPPEPPQRANGGVACGMRINSGRMSGGSVTMPQLARSFSNLVDRMVVDRTGLSGNFDVDLTWTPDPAQGRRGGPPPGVFPEPDPNGPSLFAAVQEQLGLKLESTKAPVAVLVIDRVEPPTED